MSVRTVDTPRKDKGERLQNRLVGASVRVRQGGLVCRYGGYAVPAADTAGYQFDGVSEDPANNLTGAAGAKSTRIATRGIYRVNASGLSAGDEGKLAFVVDDNTVGLTSTNLIPAGIIREVISATECWLELVEDCCQRLTIVTIPVGTVAAGQTDALLASYKLPAGHAAYLHQAVPYCTDKTGAATIDVKEGTSSVLSAAVTLTAATHTAGTVSDRSLAAGATINIHGTTAATTGAIVGGQVTVVLQLL